MTQGRGQMTEDRLARLRPFVPRPSPLFGFRSLHTLPPGVATKRSPEAAGDCSPTASGPDPRPDKLVASIGVDQYAKRPKGYGVKKGRV